MKSSLPGHTAELQQDDRDGKIEGVNSLLRRRTWNVLPAVSIAMKYQGHAHSYCHLHKKCLVGIASSSHVESSTTFARLWYHQPCAIISGNANLQLPTQFAVYQDRPTRGPALDRRRGHEKLGTKERRSTYEMGCMIPDIALSLPSGAQGRLALFQVYLVVQRLVAQSHWWVSKSMLLARVAR